MLLLGWMEIENMDVGRENVYDPLFISRTQGAACAKTIIIPRCSSSTHDSQDNMIPYQ